MTDRQLQLLKRQKEIYGSLTDEQLQIVNDYCSDNMKKLKKVCYKKIKDVCGDSNMDEDDLYSIAMDVLIRSVNIYDESQGSLDTLLSNNIHNKVNTYTRDTKYRAKRSNVQKDEDGKTVYIPNESLDAPTEDGIDLYERISSDFCIEDNLSDEFGFSSDDKIEKYLNRLSKRQRKIVLLLSDGYLQDEIRELLHISKKEYADNLLSIRAYENIRILL